MIPMQNNRPPKRGSISSRQKELSAILEARRLLLSGYVTHIVQIETGLTMKRIRAIANDLADDGYQILRKTRTLRTSKTIITSQAGKIHASIIMVLYRNLGGLYETGSSIQIKALTQAYSLYLSLLQELPESDQLRWSQPLSISDAWALARELRAHEAAIYFCKDCDASYYEAINESTRLQCPLCRNLFPSSKNVKFSVIEGNAELTA